MDIYIEHLWNSFIEERPNIYRKTDIEIIWNSETEFIKNCIQIKVSISFEMGDWNKMSR